MANEKHCIPLTSEEWNEKEFKWKNKPFFKAKYKEFMHMPLNYGKVLEQSKKKIEAAGGICGDFTLSGEESTFSSSLLIPLEELGSGLVIESLSGIFLTKLFEGNYSEVGRWAKEMTNYVRGKEREVKKLWFWHATCPKCAKELKKIQTVIFAEVK